MKECTKCHQLKPFNDFYKHPKTKDGYNSRCKECSTNNTRQITRRKQLKAHLVNIFGGKCIKCGYDKCIEALEFHHRNPSEKDFALTDYLNSKGSYDLSIIIHELNKCDLLCANCHREEHSHNNFTIAAPSIEFTGEGKKCNLCKIVKPFNQFFKNASSKDGYHSRCKECMYKYQRDISHDQKSYLISVLGGRCSKCGYSKCIEALDFHHINPELKEFEVSAKFTCRTDILIEEAKKCKVLCANCHREEHCSECSSSSVGSSN